MWRRQALTVLFSRRKRGQLGGGQEMFAVCLMKASANHFPDADFRTP